MRARPAFLRACPAAALIALARFGKCIYLRPVPIRRILSLLALMALLVTPFGRMTAEAMPHQRQGAMAGHCDEGQQPAHGEGDKAAIDCMIACATLAPASAQTAEFIAPEPEAPQAPMIRRFAGINLEADPPPPRVS
ncbi:MAG TPA: hypothetical protein VFO69_12685 [Allosphingosinicella sp.]|nr:hypothetical protein [Allosphingosinicella sp.]